MSNRFAAIFTSIYAANGTRLVSLNEEFRKAKRNLLWISGAVFLFAWSKPGADGQYEIKVLSDFVIDQNVLTIGLLLFLIYNWMGYSREVRRVNHEASSAARSLDGGNTKIRGETAIRQFEATVAALGKAFENWRNELLNLGAKLSDAENSETEIGASLAEISKRLIFLEQKSIKTQQNIMAFYECTDQDKRLYKVATEHQRVAKELSSEIFGVSAEVRHLASRASPSDYQKQFSTLLIAEQVADGHVEKLEQVQRELRVRSEEFIKFASDLDGQDVRSHLVQDRLIPYGFATVALTSCVLFKVEFVSSLLTHIGVCS